MLACEQGHVAIIEYPIEHGGCVLFSDVTNQTCLHLETALNNLSLVIFLSIKELRLTLETLTANPSSTKIYRGSLRIAVLVLSNSE